MNDTKNEETEQQYWAAIPYHRVARVGVGISVAEAIRDSVAQQDGDELTELSMHVVRCTDNAYKYICEHGGAMPDELRVGVPAGKKTRWLWLAGELED